MAYLLDTNIIGRLAQAHAPEYPVVAAAVIKLLQSGETLCVCPQVLTEFWAMATRPGGPPTNGMGLTPAEADTHVQTMLTYFTMVYEPLMIFDTWRDLVRSLSIMGKAAHDARIAALVLDAEIGSLLTLNPRHFQRFDGIAVVRPDDVT